MTDTLSTIQKWASIASAIAIPLVIALVGWWVQTSISTEGVRRDYVQMAVGVLGDPTKQKEGLREWALRVLEKNSPVPFGATLRTELLKGASSLPMLGSTRPIPGPELSLMVAPEKLEPLPPEGKGASEREQRNFSVCSAISARLEGLQAWAQSVPARTEVRVIDPASIRIIPPEEAQKLREKLGRPVRPVP
jgi:hypothetical protein